jgi:hypothetical protein
MHNEGHDIVISVDDDRSSIVRGSGRHVKFGNLSSGRFCYSFSEIGAPSGRFSLTFHNKVYTQFFHVFLAVKT